MKPILGDLRRHWMGLDTRLRRWSMATMLLLMVILAVSASLWLRAEHARLQKREGVVEARLKEMQNRLAEIQRLKRQAVPPALTGQALRDTIGASLQSRGLSLAVSMVDGERVRVQGIADFDETVNWLGNVQQSHRLGVVALSAKRQDAVAVFDLILSSAQE